MVIYVLSLSTDPTQLRWLTRRVGRPKNTKKLKKIKKYKNENCQKHVILVNLGFREYQNRIQHVHKSVHAKYELCSCQERRVMTILRPLGAARSCQELPVAPSGGKNPRTIGSCESKVACKFFIVFRVFECLICKLF